MYNSTSEEQTQSPPCNLEEELIQSIPFVSVIVPVRNGSKTIRACLDSILNQDYPPDQFKIIVVDNDSTDNTMDIVSSYAGITVLPQTEVHSSYATRNVGVNYAEGDVIVFTDADCLPEPTWLSKLISPFSDPHVMAVGGMVLDSQEVNLVEKFQKEVSLLSKYQKTSHQFLKPLITANV